MLTTLIPNFESEIEQIHELAPSGLFLMFGFSFWGPEHVYQNYHPEWTEIYQRRNYYFADPVFAWILSNTGSKRWSEIRLPDVRNVMKEARRFNMKYGAAFSQRHNATTSTLTVTRSDRELTDAEIDFVDAKFCTWGQLVMNKPPLTAGELDVLRGLKDGLGQREIATQLGISESTVKQRAIKACGKLHAKTRTQAVAIAVQRNYFLTT